VTGNCYKIPHLHNITERLLVNSNLLWTQGKGLLLIFTLLFVLSPYFSKKIFGLILCLFIFTIWFFRNPERFPDPQVQPSSIISPSDGKVVDVQDRKISIFLSPVDVHVNWCPIAGNIQRVTHTKGQFLPAYKAESSRVNENNEIEIMNDHGQSLVVKQVAGTIARRIVCWVEENEQVSRGQKYGMIKFGSRIDILFPENVELYVEKGQRVYGGETIIGSFLWESQKDFSKNMQKK
jgi:phosphatidylserine decarboxylase